MAEVSTIARPYAKAAFEFADQQGQLAQWSEMLGFAAGLLANDDIQQAVESPSLSTEQKLELIFAIAGDELNTPVQNLIKTLADHKRLSVLPSVQAAFEVLKAEREASVDVQVTSAFALTPEQEQKLATGLQAKWNKDVTISSKVDSALIGGVIIRAGDMVIDNSVRGKLGQVAEAVHS